VSRPSADTLIIEELGGLVSSLSALDFFDSENRPIDGLVSVRRPGDAKSPHEQAVIRQAQDFEIIDYVFFRRVTGAIQTHIQFCYRPLNSSLNCEPPPAAY
jgi:hypothetical protein